MKKHKLIHFYCIPFIVLAVSILFYLYSFNTIALFTIIIYSGYEIISLYNYWKSDQDKKVLSKYIESSISEHVSNIIQPIILINGNGEIIWHNKRFSEIRNDNDLIGRNILSIINGINLERILKNNSTNHQKIRVDEKYYDVQSVKIKNDSSEYSILYFYDISEILTVDGLIEGIVLIEVDNLNDVLDATDQNNRPLVAAEIERQIDLYASSKNAMIKKYDTNKYVLTMQNKYIEGEIENNFSIFDTISNIDKGNTLEITISIGIGRGGLSPLENSNYATTALELALGRGGDQVVIKDGDDTKFFRGNSKEIEKRTRVRARVVSHALKELIYESDKVYIVGHENPDMDCFGSAVALSSVIKQLGKECNIILNNDIKAIEYYLNNLKESGKYNDRFISLEEASRGLNKDTLVIVVDVHNKSYISCLELVERAKKKVIIDHHRRSPDMILGAILNYIEVYASSTSEMITEMIQYMTDNPAISILEAEGLLAGIYMDTKGFSFKTGVRTFEAASFLKGKGADTIEIKKMFTDNLEDYLLIADTIKSAEVDERRKCAIAICPHKVSSVIIAKSADELLNISGILVSFVLGEIDGDIYISGRSVGDINVQTVLESLGGGGHMNIAGTKLSGISLEEALLKLKEKIDKYLKVGE